ncbi:MAG: caspase family protein [Methylococcales bacterium]
MNLQAFHFNPHNLTLWFTGNSSPSLSRQGAALHQILVLVITTILGLLFSLPLCAQNTRLALVIGNADYKANKLANAVNDAEDMAQKLEHLNFDVMHFSNMDKRSMDNAVREFSSKTSAYGVILFYFAGHAIQIDGKNFLIPVNMDFNIRKSELEYDAVNASKVLDMMSEIPNKTNLFILDACRDNPFRSFSRSMDRGLAPMGQATGTLIAYATAPGSVSDDGEGRNGIYTEHLLKYIDKPGLTVEQMLKQVRIEVLQATADQQTPWENSSLRGDFCFAGCENSDALKAKQLNDENARLIAQIADIKREYEAEKLANQERLEKLATIEQQKETLEQRIDTEQSSKATQQALQEQLDTLKAEKQQLEAKVAVTAKNSASNQKMLDELERYKMEVARLKKSAPLTGESVRRAIEPPENPINPFQVGGG